MDAVIHKIGYEDAKAFIKDRSLILNPNNVYYGLFVDGNLVSASSVAFKKRGSKLQANFTPEEHRRKGYFSALLDYLLCVLPLPIYADCLHDSVGIYKAKGFTVYKEKQFKRFKIYYCRKEHHHDYREEHPRD